MNDIHYLINQKENKTLQFEKDISQIDSIVKTAIAFCNTNGGDLIIGIDKEQNIVGIDKQNALKIREDISDVLYNTCFPHIIPEIYNIEIDEKMLLLIHLNSSMQKPHYIRSEGRQQGTYIRNADKSILANQHDLNSLDRFKRRQYFELSNDSDIPWDLTHFTLFSQHVIDKLDVEPDLAFFEKYKLIKKNKDSYKITNLGIWVSDLKNQLFPSLNVICNKKSAENEALDSQIYKDEILSVFDKVNIYLKSISLIRENEDIYSIINELFVNALIHRDYSLINKSIELNINENSIEIISPGILGLNIEMLNLGYCAPVNHCLHNLLSKFKLTKSIKRGTKRIRDFLLNNQDLDLYIKEEKKCVKIKLLKGQCYDPKKDGYLKFININEPNNDPKTILKVTNKNLIDPKNDSSDPNKVFGVPKDRYDLIINKMFENSSISITMLSELLEVSEKTIKRDIEKLKRNGIIRRIGQKRNGYWEVIGK